MASAYSKDSAIMWSPLSSGDWKIYDVNICMHAYIPAETQADSTNQAGWL